MNDSEDSENLSNEISKIKWYHCIEIPGYGITPGSVGKDNQDWISANIPPSLKGLSILDIGGWDGFYSFLAEERGANRVLMLDELQNAEAHSSGTKGFELAKKAKKSKVEFRLMSAYDMDQIDERFDLIFFFGVYYHLLNPFNVLTNIYKHLNEGGLLLMEGILLPGKTPYLRFFEDWDIEPTTYCGASESGLIKILKRTGFRNVEVLSKRRGSFRIIRHVYKFMMKYNTVNNRVVNVGRSFGLRSHSRIIISARK